MPPPPHLAVLGEAREHHFEKWLPALVEQGLDVSLISINEPLRSMPGVTFHQLPKAPVHFGYLDFWQGKKALRALLDRTRPDVLMASYATTYGVMAMRIGFKPLIIQTWTIDMGEAPRTGWKRLFYKPLMRRVFQGADYITTDGPALKQIAEETFPEFRSRFVSTLWGIRLSDYRPVPGLREKARAEWGIPASAPLITSARGIRDWFRPECVLPALLQLLESRSEAHALVLTLNRARPPEIQALLDTLATHPRGHVADRYLSTEEMRTVWAMTDAFISIPPYDGISEGILEGMYAGGIPVVSDIASNRAFLDEDVNAVFVPGPSTQDLLGTLEQVVDTLPDLKATMTLTNKVWIENNASVEKTARQVADLVRALADSGF